MFHFGNYQLLALSLRKLVCVKNSFNQSCFQFIKSKTILLYINDWYIDNTILIEMLTHVMMKFPIVSMKDINYSKYKAFIQLWYNLMAIFKKLFWRCYRKDYRYLLTELLIFYVNRIVRITFFVPVATFSSICRKLPNTFFADQSFYPFRSLLFCSELSDYKYINISQILRENCAQIL